MKAQKPTAKQTSNKESLQSAVAELVDPWKNKLVNIAKDWDRFKDILKNNYELGQSHLQRGNIDDAVLHLDTQDHHAHGGRFLVAHQPGTRAAGSKKIVEV
jgi:hypothetical protein